MKKKKKKCEPNIFLYAFLMERKNQREIVCKTYPQKYHRCIVSIIFMCC